VYPCARTLIADVDQVHKPVKDVPQLNLNASTYDPVRPWKDKLHQSLPLCAPAMDGLLLPQTAAWHSVIDKSNRFTPDFEATSVTLLHKFMCSIQKLIFHCLKPCKRHSQYERSTTAS
jgi:hypothetical protein